LPDYKVLITANSIGRGSQELGEKLMSNYLMALAEGTDLPSTIFFINSGVKLLTEDSTTCQILRSLEEKGVELLACGTCVDYYQLREQIQIGQISNIFTLRDLLSKAEKMVTIG
jgi:selenium metabolism protein YedF